MLLFSLPSAPIQMGHFRHRWTLSRASEFRESSSTRFILLFEICYSDVLEFLNNDDETKSDSMNRVELDSRNSEARDKDFWDVIVAKFYDTSYEAQTTAPPNLDSVN